MSTVEKSTRLAVAVMVEQMMRRAFRAGYRMSSAEVEPDEAYDEWLTADNISIAEIQQMMRGQTIGDR